jgi:hypothetical protein
MLSFFILKIFNLCRGSLSAVSFLPVESIAAHAIGQPNLHRLEIPGPQYASSSEAER